MSGEANVRVTNFLHYSVGALSESLIMLRALETTERGLVTEGSSSPPSWLYYITTVCRLSSSMEWLVPCADLSTMSLTRCSCSVVNLIVLPGRSFPRWSFDFARNHGEMTMSAGHDRSRSSFVLSLLKTQRRNVLWLHSESLRRCHEGLLFITSKEDVTLPSRPGLNSLDLLQTLKS